MELYDISVPLSPDLPRWPGDPPVRFKSSAPPGVVTRMSFGSHCGTHLDLPGHEGIEGLSADRLPLSGLIGPCLVVDLTAHAGPVDQPILAAQSLSPPSRLLLKTGNSALWQEHRFVRDFQALTAEGASWLIARGVRLIGIDYLSIEGWQGDGSVHRQLLEAGVIILEGLDLAAVEAGCYELLCLPLKVPLGDGAPCRAVLRRGS